MVIGVAIEVHRELGPGLLESAYESAFAYELKVRGIEHERQKLLPMFYKGLEYKSGFRVDLLVENQLVLELKAIEALLPVHSSQVLITCDWEIMPLGS